MEYVEVFRIKVDDGQFVLRLHPFAIFVVGVALGFLLRSWI